MSRDNKATIKKKRVIDSLTDAYFNPYRDYPVSRSDLVDDTGLARSTIFDILEKLVDLNIVKRKTVKSGKFRRGRPAVFWLLCSLE